MPRISVVAVEHHQKFMDRYRDYYLGRLGRETQAVASGRGDEGCDGVVSNIGVMKPYAENQVK